MISNEQKILLKHLIDGKTNIEISIEMDYSPSTVKRRLKTLYKLLKVNNKFELIRNMQIKLLELFMSSEKPQNLRKGKYEQNNKNK